MFRAGKEPEQLMATLSPGWRPSSWNMSTTTAAMLGLVEVRLASSSPRVVVMREKSWPMTPVSLISLAVLMATPISCFRSWIAWMHVWVRSAAWSFSP